MARILLRVATLAVAAAALAACETISEAASSTSEAVGSWYQSAKGAVAGTDNDAKSEQSYIARQVGGDLAKADAEAMDREGAKALDQGTSGKAIEWRNPDTGVQVVFVPGDPVLEERQMSAVLKDGVVQPKDLEVIGAVYQSRHNANVRAAPGIENAVVGRLSSGEPFTAVGRTRSLAWILVAKDGQIVGYVYEPLVTPLPAADPVPELREAAIVQGKNGETTASGTILAATPCRNLSYDVVTGDGQRARAELRACKAGDGAWEIN